MPKKAFAVDSSKNSFSGLFQLSKQLIQSDCWAKLLMLIFLELFFLQNIVKYGLVSKSHCNDRNGVIGW